MTAEEAKAILESMKVQKEGIWIDLDENQQEGFDSDLQNDDEVIGLSEVDTLRQRKDPAGEHEPADSCNMGTVMSSLNKKLENSKSDNQRTIKTIIDEKDQRISVLLNMLKETKQKKENELKQQKNQFDKILENSENNNAKLADELKSVRRELLGVKASTCSTTPDRSQGQMSTEIVLTSINPQVSDPLTQQNDGSATQYKAGNSAQLFNVIPDKIWQNSMSNTKREYRLTRKTDFEMFFDYLSSELRLMDLLYVIDDKVQPLCKRNDTSKKMGQYKVRDIIMNHIDTKYYRNISKDECSKKILTKLKKMKSAESNVTSGTIRKSLFTIQFMPHKEKALEFRKRFDDLVAEFEVLPDTSTLSSDEQRDAFYNAIIQSVPSVKQLDFLHKKETGQRLSFEELKEFIMQDEAERQGGANQTGTQPAAMLATRKPRFAVTCRNCLAKGHSKNDCPNPGQVRCRTCLNLGHIAKDCPTGVVSDQRPNGSGDFNRGGRGKRGRFGNNRGGGSTKRLRPNQS